MEIIDTPPPGSDARNLEDLIANGYEFRMSDYINRGYELFKQNMGLFIAFTVLFFIIMWVSAFIPFSGLLISAPLGMGMAIAAFAISRQKPVEMGTFFQGFNFFLPLLVVSLVSGILTMVGFFLLLIPGIYLAVAYGFSSYLVVFQKMEFWDAMEGSRKLITKNWFSFFGFFIVLGLINLAGAIALGVGLLFTIPITACAIYASFESIVGVSSDPLQSKL